jgi:hypothetical protein
MTTDRLIERLAHELQPVRPLPRPGIRTALWLTGAMIYLTLIAAPLTSPPDTAANTADPIWFFLPQALALVVGIVAALAAFTSVTPGYSRRPAIVAAIATAAWAGTMAVGARGQWSEDADPSLPSEWLCVVLIVTSGAPLALAVARMLRQGAVFNPALTAALSALAVTSLASVAACFTHPHTNPALTFVWHGATLAAAVIVFITIAPRVFLKPGRA